MSGEEIYKQRLRDAFSNSPMPDFQARKDVGKSPLMPVEEKFTSTNTARAKWPKRHFARCVNVGMQFNPP